MTTVNTGYGVTNPTHDISLEDIASTKYGLIFSGGTRVLQEMPLSPPAQEFSHEHRNWIGGRGRNRYEDDPTGFYDSLSLWSTSDEKIMPMLQWRFANSIRSCDSSLPDDNASMAWWKLYGNTPASKISRYLSISFVASASYSADKGYLWIRKRGTPVDNLLTFELCADSTGSPGTVLKTATVTGTNITDTISVFRHFDWTTTESLTSGTTYHIKIYGGANDTAANHWEVLGNASGTSSKYSSDGSAWSAASISMYYRITDADISRQWKFFSTPGAFYAVSMNDSGAASSLILNGVRGTASSGTATTLTNSSLTMTTNRFTGAFLHIIAGTGDGQVRQIASNTATEFTVSPAWDITPDATSVFVMHTTSYWTTATGTQGLGAVKGKPIVVNGVIYFPQGQAVNIRRARVNGNSHDYADDGTNKADLLYLNVEGSAPLIYAAGAADATIQSASVVPWNTNLTLSAVKYVGTNAYRITNMHSHSKTMRVFKEDGLYTYNNGIIEREGQNFSDAPDSSTGLGVASQNNYLWFSWGHSVERMAGSSVDDMLNFKRGYDGIPDNRKGPITCIVSAVGWLFFVIDGGVSNYSSIICWNGMGWHEVFRAWSTGVRIRNAAWQPCIGSRGRLWFDVGGDMAYIEFPKHAANPLEDSGINYQHEGVLVTPTYSGGDENLYKILGTLRLFSESVLGPTKVRYTSVLTEIDYQTNANVGTDNWTVLGSTSNSQFDEFALNFGSVLKVRFRFRLQVTSSRFPTVLAGWKLQGRIMSPDKYQYLCTFRADSDAETKTDEDDHNPDTLYDQLVTWAANQSKLTLRSTIKSVDNSGSGRSVTISLPAKSVSSLDTEENKWTGQIQFAILET